MLIKTEPTFVQNVRGRDEPYDYFVTHTIVYSVIVSYAAVNPRKFFSWCEKFKN